MTAASTGRGERMLVAFSRLTAVQQEKLIGLAEMLGGKPVDDNAGADRAADASGIADTDCGVGAGAETVIGALKRLRRTYPDLDRRSVMGEASEILAQHALHGHPASEMIGQLERLFEHRAASRLRNLVRR